MSTRRHFPLRSSVRILLQYCGSDRGKEQLELLRSYSTFEVVSQSSGRECWDTLEPTVEVQDAFRRRAIAPVQERSVGMTKSMILGRDHHGKRTRNGDDDGDRGTSCVFFLCVPRCKVCVMLGERTNEGLFWVACFAPALVGTPDRSYAHVEDVQDLGQSSYPSSGESTPPSPPPTIF